MIEQKITNEQKVEATIAPATATGKPASIDGKPSWTVASGDATIDIASDGMSAQLISGDAPGDSVILVEVDADLGEGVETVSDTIKLTVEGAKAASLGLTLGTPAPK